jgi:membrane-associated phospholipid phosphatase
MILSRIYLGMHSSDQVLVGLALGLFMIITYRFYLEKLIINTLKYLLYIKIVKEKKKIALNLI